MNSTQTRHTVPVQKADKTLIGTGIDKTLAHVLDSTFVFNAKQDGKVIHYDDKTKIMVLQYKDGSKDAIDLRDKLDKNGGGGFYITNAKETKLKVGNSFKKGDILAYNKNYFSDNEGNPDYTVGTLAKVAVYSGLNIVHLKLF